MNIACYALATIHFVWWLFHYLYNGLPEYDNSDQEHI